MTTAPTRKSLQQTSLLFSLILPLICCLSFLPLSCVKAQTASRGECIYFATTTAAIGVIDTAGSLVALPTLESFPTTTGIEVIGDVLYIASGTLSTVNMYNISDNLKFIDQFVAFDEGFYLESLSYDPVTNTMYASCDDFPFVLKVNMDSTPASPALNYTGFLSTAESLDLAGAVWYVRVIRNSYVDALVIPSLSNVIGLKSLDNLTQPLELIFDYRSLVFGPLRWTGIWPLQGQNDTILVSQVRPYNDMSLFVLHLNGTLLGELSNSTDGYYDATQDSAGFLYAATVNSYAIEKRTATGTFLGTLYQSLDAPPVYLRIATCPIIDPLPPNESSSDNTLVIVLSVVLPVVFCFLLCVIFCLLLLLLVSKIRADRRHKALALANEEEMILLAKQYDDGLPESGIELRERTTASMRDVGATSSGNLTVNSRRLSLQFQQGAIGDGRSTFRSLNRDDGDNDEPEIQIHPDKLRFPEIGAKGLFPIRSPQKATFRLINRRKKPIDFEFFVPKDKDRFIVQLWPGEGSVSGGGGEVVVTVKVELLMTTNIFRYIRLDIRDVGSYYCPLSLAGEVSTFLDPDEVETFLPPIGHGAFGTVYKGKYRGSNVAVKIVNEVYQSNSGQSDFDKEVELLTKLRSPYVLNFLGASHVLGKLCILTEFMKGGSLSRAIYSDSKMRYGVILRVAIDAASAVAYLHENGVLHRDIKPDNFLVISLSAKAAVTVKVADFGTSKLVQDPMEPYTHTMGIGTPMFMAPELLNVLRERRPYSAKVDVFSMGVLLWILYHREEPYRELKKIWDIPKVVVEGGRPEFSDECPDDYRDLVEHCWKQEPQDRPEMADVVEKLKEIYEDAEERNMLDTKRGPGREGFRGIVRTDTTGMMANWQPTPSKDGGSGSGDKSPSSSSLSSERTSTTQHSHSPGQRTTSHSLSPQLQPRSPTRLQRREMLDDYNHQDSSSSDESSSDDDKKDTKKK